MSPSSPVSAPSRNRAPAATALAEGVAPSRSSVGRTTRLSASDPVVNSGPPSVGEEPQHGVRRLGRRGRAIGPHRSARPRGSGSPRPMRSHRRSPRWRACPDCQDRSHRPSPGRRRWVTRNSAMRRAASAQSPAAGGAGRLGQRRAEHGVPLGEDLVVEAGSDAAAAGLEEEAAGLFDVGRSPQRCPRGTTQDRAAFEVAAVGDPVPLRRHGTEPGAGRVGDLGRAPHVETALLALGVGVLGAVEPALRRRPGPAARRSPSPRPPGASGRRRRRGRRGGRCAPDRPGRRASSRSGARSRWRRSSTGRSLRRDGRRSPRRPWRPTSCRPWPASRRHR